MSERLEALEHMLGCEREPRPSATRAVQRQLPAALAVVTSIAHSARVPLHWARAGARGPTVFIEHLVPGPSRAANSSVIPRGPPGAARRPVPRSCAGSRPWEPAPGLGQHLPYEDFTLVC